MALTLPITIGQGGWRPDNGRSVLQRAGSNRATKGDIIAYNGTNNVRFGVCANGQAIIGDSTQGDGAELYASRSRNGHQ